jgi:transcriptional regulator with XRE-family HTH domain
MTPKTQTEVNYILNMRRNRGLAQKQLALLIGHRYTSMLSKYERGRSLPPLETALLIEIALGVRLSELYPNLYRALTRTVVERANRLPADIRRVLRGRLERKDLYDDS